MRIKNKEKKMNKQITRRQHYIPKMILKRHALSQICENDK